MTTENKIEGSKSDWLKAGNSEVLKNFLTNIDKLSKKSTVQEGLRNFAMGLPLSIIIIFLSIIWSKTDFGIQSLDNLDSATRGWTKLTNMLIPVAQVFLLLVGIIGFFVSLYFGYTAFIAKASSTIAVKCPGCSKNYEFSRIYRKKFKFVCPDCMSLVIAKTSEYNIKHHCNYCDYTFYNGVFRKFKCPSCNFKEGVGEKKCRQCGTKIPKSVLFCNSCFQWIALQETPKSSGRGDPVCYNVELFSGKTCKSYINNLIPRINSWSDNFAEYSKNIENIRNENLYNIGGIYHNLQDLFHLIGKCDEAIEMLYLKNLRPEADELMKLKDKVYRLSQSFDEINLYGNLREKDYKLYSGRLKRSLDLLS